MLRSDGPEGAAVSPRAVRKRAISASICFLVSSLFNAGFLLFNWPLRIAKGLVLAEIDGPIKLDGDFLRQTHAAQQHREHSQ